jgi:hypothetical protein
VNKVKVFEKELSWIVDPKIKAFAEKLIECAPDYFFEVAASSTGKYHPSYSLGPGGLVRHTKSATAILHELTSNLEMFNKYSQDQKDMMLVAIMAHDFFKHGLAAQAGKYTVAEHPVVCADFIRYNDKVCNLLEREQIEFIAGCVASHMGQFCFDYKSKKQILPKPQTGPQNLVHLADYLASRKFLTLEFGEDYYELIVKEEPANYAEIGTDLENVKNKIVLRCKTLIAAGMDNKELYALIAAENGGNRNPNSICDLAVANNVLKILEKVGA